MEGQKYIERATGNLLVLTDQSWFEHVKEKFHTFLLLLAEEIEHYELGVTVHIMQELQNWQIAALHPFHQ